jgi:hypothetical protein
MPVGRHLLGFHQVSDTNISPHFNLQILTTCLQPVFLTKIINLPGILMTTRPRATSPRLWSGLALSGAALGLGLAAPAAANIVKLSAPAQTGIWLAQAEGGEGGEAGAVAEVQGDVAYLGRLAIVEGHLIAAAALYTQGLHDEAIGLSYHPEAEMMDEVRNALAARGASDFSPLMEAFSQSMENGEGTDKVASALATFSNAVAAAGTYVAATPRERFDVIVVLLKAAADEYAGSIEDGEVSDLLAYTEARAFVDVARERAHDLAGEPTASVPVAKALKAMIAADEAFGASGMGPVANDPAILMAVAGRVELIASQVK